MYIITMTSPSLIPNKIYALTKHHSSKPILSNRNLRNICDLRNFSTNGSPVPLAPDNLLLHLL